MLCWAWNVSRCEPRSQSDFGPGLFWLSAGPATREVRWSRTPTRQGPKVRDTGTAHLIECADEALAALLAGDRRLRALCTRLGELQLVVPAEKLPAFRKALLAQGYPLA